MSSPAPPIADARPDAVPRPTRRRGPAGIEILALVLLVLVLLRPVLLPFLSGAAVTAWTTIFISVTVQALPFLVLGVVISGLIAAFLSPSFVARVLPRRPAAAVPVAGIAGLALPGCECGSVPIAGRLTSRGVPAAAALTFMLSAPAINPVVLVSTAVAFQGQPRMVVARFLASLLASVLVGLVWSRFGDEAALLERVRRTAPATGNRWRDAAEAARHDVLHAGGWLVVGAGVAATLQVTIPRTVVDDLGAQPVLAVLVMGLLAVVLAICSEADAFVAVGLTAFPLSARLVFLVVGPAVDIKLIALQAGVFGRRFAASFAPLVFVCAVLSAVLVGRFLL